MTTAASPAPAAAAPATTAQPAAVARASVDEKTSSDTLSSREARDFLKQRRAERTKLRLARVEDEPAQTSVEPEAKAETVTPDNAGEVDGSAETNEDKPPEQEPTWAQKLRTDLSKKTERVAELEKQHQAREAKFAEAHRAVQHRIEDQQADIKAEQAYSAMLEKAIADAGFVVPADWKRAMLAERKAERLERHLARGQTAQRAVGHEKSAVAATEQIQALGQKIPEIAAALAGKDAEARAWLAKRFAMGDDGKASGLGLKNLEEDALAFAKALRWDRHSKAQAQKRPAQAARPGEGERPTSTTLNGSTSNAGGKRMPLVPQTQKESEAWLAARRAARK